MHLRTITLFTLYWAIANAALAAASLRDYAWQLHHPDWTRMEAAIRRAPEFGVTAIELSHDIITTVDQLRDEPATRELVQKTIALCDELHLKVYVWAKELNIGEHLINTDLDPNGGGKAMWEARRAAYRAAFAACPGLTGVVLQFGSCPTEPWELSDGASAFNAATPCEERIKLIVNIVKEECDAAGKRLDVRDFNHSPAQQQCMRDGFQLVSGVRAVNKEVPQDWQVYYPLNPMIGDVGGNENAVEFDLGCEYWGCSKVPFAMVDYLGGRMHAMASKGISGVVVRAERGDDAALGTPNELNLYAMARLVKDADTAPDSIYADWLKQRYHVDAATPAGQALIAAFRLSFDAGRKMFYVLNHWALEKSSQIPDSARADCLYFKALPQWDPEYKADWQALTQPKAPVLLKIWQEKTEAVELAQEALAKLAEAKEALAAEDYAPLEAQFTDLAHCAEVWRFATDGIFRAMQWMKSPEDKKILEGDARGLVALAAQYPTLPLASKKRVTGLVADLRKRFDAQTEIAAPAGNLVHAVEARALGSGAVEVHFRTDTIAPGRVEFGPRLPRLEQHVNEGTTGTDHTVRIEGLAPGARIYLRAGTDALMSGDYSVEVK